MSFIVRIILYISFLKHNSLWLLLFCYTSLFMLFRARVPATWTHGWSEHGSSMIHSVFEGFMLEPCLLQPQSVSIISIFSIRESQIRTKWLWIFVWHHVGFQCARVSAQKTRWNFGNRPHVFTWPEGEVTGPTSWDSVFEGFMLEPCLLQPCFHVAGCCFNTFYYTLLP